MDDDAEVEAIYRRYGPMVVRRCRRLLGEETEAWDVAQEVFVRVLKQWPRLDHRYPSSLLFRIATNLSLNRLRDRRREPLLPGDEVLLALREGQRQELTRSELKQAERLPTRLRGSERVADTRLPRFGIRYTARAVEGIGASSFESRLEFAPAQPALHHPASV